MKRGLKYPTPALLLCTALSGSAYAQGTPKEPPEKSDEAVGLGLDPMLSLDPSAPNVGALPGGVAPAYGQKATGAGDWRFDFHGFFTMPLVAGINTREDPDPGDSETVLHAPPLVPDDKETFPHTGVVPTPYAQLNFSYGNNIITGNVQLLAEQPTVSQGYFDPPSQAGINDVFLKIEPYMADNVNLDLYFGAFSNRYGRMGEYDQGRYGTPLIASTNGVGETAVATLAITPELTLALEQGIQGQSNSAPADLTPAGWNDFADPDVGASFLNHVHAGINYRGLATLGLHYMRAFSQDDGAAGPLQADGGISVFGSDLRLSLGRFGHLYLGFAYTDADNAGTVGRIIEVLNTRGGPGLIENYLGDQSAGNGSLTTFGGQYDLSIGRLVSYPVPFYGDGPDLFVSAFGLGTLVKSDDTRYDDLTKLKLGGMATYSLLSWLAASLRYDRVDPNLDETRYSFAVISPQVIFRTDWQSSDQIVLSYSHWLNGSLTTVRTGYPPQEDVTAIPDEDVVSLSASMWW